MAKKDCPLCEGRRSYFVANTNIKIDCEFCVKGVVSRPENFDPAKLEPGLLARLQAGLGRLITTNS